MQFLNGQSAKKWYQNYEKFCQTSLKADQYLTFTKFSRYLGEEYVTKQQIIKKKKTNGFINYEILNWNVFAEAIKNKCL